EGNLTAQKILSKVFYPIDAEWRGIGEISQSGLALREEFADFDAEKILPVEVEKISKRTACRCGEVLRGIVTPKDCPLFRKICHPLHAIGPCMVSVEGICAAWYRFSG
ncbi:MAG: hydrogenase formation protein HypD, partial [Selenomonadaceae bacterium]|nr:hydrogenase formation protein HypD [Selenomonadaceae bacterium]